MAKKQYTIERDGQMEFFDAYQIPYEDDDSILVDNTDGVYNGCLFEFKLNISNLNKVLFQAIKYLSKMRIKGESVPATIILVSLNDTMAYIYRSENYRDPIHHVYAGAASKDNDNFAAGNPDAKYDYSDMAQSAQLRHILKDAKPIADMYMPVKLDEDCIVGWAERYYRENPKATKGDFLGDDTGTQIRITGEIRNPKHFAGHILPYQGKTNEKFKYLMDCLNDRLSKKDLGAFYTPEAYCKKAAELVQMAVERVPDGNDYIILDRCAGTGNLEAALVGLYDNNGSELISHCVVSTYEYYEYKVLMERIGDKVREVIPPSEANVVYANGKVANADAMSKEYIENPIIRQYVDDPKCTIILFENPPYQDSSSISYQDDEGHRGKTGRKDTFVCQEYKKELSKLNEGKGSFRDLSNLFIWSGFHYYLRYDSDSYVLFSPIKYWKTVGLAEKKFIQGYLFNRRYFHATESAISCILWSNEAASLTSLYLTAMDIVDDVVKDTATVTIRKVKESFLPFFDKRSFVDDVVTTVWSGRDGDESSSDTREGIPLYNENIIGYLRPIGFSTDGMNRSFTRQMYFGRRGFYIRKDNYLEKIVLFVAKNFPMDNWYEKDVYYTTSDGGDAYAHDKDFLKSCLIYTCLSNQNKCLTFDGSDGRHYQNELCFDADTLASRDLKSMNLDEEEKALMDLWYKILDEAKATANYNPAYTYGVYQITKELNTFDVDGKTKVYHYPDLNGDLITLRNRLKDYYKSHITEKMFAYELLK